MTWCRAMRVSVDDFVSRREYGLRDDPEAAVAVVNQPVAGPAGQFGLAIGQQYLEWFVHLQRKDAIAQAEIGAGLARLSRRLGPVLVGKVRARNAPALPGNTGQDRIASLCMHHALGRMHRAGLGGKSD